MHYSILGTNFTYKINWFSNSTSIDNHNYFKHIFYIWNNQGYYMIDERNRSYK